MQKTHCLSSITQRELQVLKLISMEFSSKEIAQELFISCHTVISHRENLKSKMSVKNTAGLVRCGFEQGYLHIC